MQNTLAELVSNLIDDEKLKKLIDSLKKLCSESIGMQPTKINHHPQYIKICQELKEIQFDFVFNQSMKLKELPGIYATRIEKNKFFTLAFLMMSENSVIGWHSHPKMNAVSKCLFGEIQVQVLDKTKLERMSPEDIRYQYPRQYLKKKILSPKEKSLAFIDDCTYNIHQITCHKQAGFLDLLMPEYPDQQCQYYKEVSMKDEKYQEVLIFESLDEPVEKISVFGKLRQAIKPKEENQTTVSVSQE